MTDIQSKITIPDIYSLLQSALQQMEEGALVFSQDGKILDSNSSAEIITGYSGFELHTVFFSSLLSNREDYFSIRKALEKEVYHINSFDMVRKNGEHYTSKIKISKTEIGQSTQLFLVTFENSSFQSRAEQELLVARKIYENIEEGVLYTDHGGKILSVNPAFEIVTGYLEEEVLGKNPNILQSGYHQADFYQALWKDVHEKGYWKGEIWNKRKNGEIFPEWLTISSVSNEYGRVTNYVAVFSDITDRKQKEKQIQKLSNYDALTGTTNRYILSQELLRLIETANKYNQVLAVLFLDLDRFKVINETLGHNYGDLLLKKVASRIKGMLKSKDLIARFGGDEFVIVLPNIKHAKEAVQISEDIIQALEQPFLLDNQEVYATTSIGISLYPHDGDGVEVLIKNAEKAVHKAKENGGSSFELFYEELQPFNKSRRIILENGLRKAIENDELMLYYQPQASLKTGHLTGVEALLRWYHSELGYISPGEFIPIAEETGLIISISEWVINQACEEVKRLHISGHTNLKVGINISGVHFSQSDFLKRVSEIIQNTNINPYNVDLELTESMIMPNAKDSIDKLVKLKRMGLKLSIDDFGTGYSSLSYLHRFPIDTLKIDQSFIQNLMSVKGDAAIIKAIITMAKTLQLDIIAEGVEDKKQLDFLEQENCDIIQGFYLSKPIPFPELVQFLEMWNPDMLSGK
ncbi:EAL domain-containing protein [Peribacillus asahii]|uniref:sensor domain-containing protein n=1 Tax=Peribacillus asahii TaxID=228899 RepID=UPI0037F92E61